MRYRIRQKAAGGPWEVVSPDGRVLHANVDRSRASALCAAAWLRGTGITAAAPPPEGGTEFYAVLAFTGAETSDGRMFDALDWREPPLALFTQFAQDDYHDGAEITGRIDEISLDGNRVLGRGWFDGSESAQTAVRQAQEQSNNGISIDATSAEMPEFECMGWDEDGWCTRERTRWVQATITAATQVATPAFAGAMIAFDAYPSTTADPADDAPEPPEGTGGGLFDLLFASGRPVARPAAADPGCGCPSAAAQVVELPSGGHASAAIVAAANALLAAAVVPPEEPPAEWFTDPRFTTDHPLMAWADEHGRPVPAGTPGARAVGVPLTLTDDGRMFGHIATRSICHVGVADDCVLAPESRSSYAYFRTGTVRTAEGTDVPTGTLTMGTGHASVEPGQSAQAAMAHYDHTGTAVADLAAGDDEFGVWVAGAARPGLSAEQVRAIRAAAPSGDWRRIGGNLELVAVLQVNVPGFPTPRQYVAASGAPEALVAAGAYDLLVASAVRLAEPWRAPYDALAQQVKVQGRVIDALLPLAGEAIVASLPVREPVG